jgi:excinuclease UvrABC nuclease subunit
MGVDLRKKLEDLPRSAGVYLFKGQGGEILYQVIQTDVTPT